MGAHADLFNTDRDTAPPQLSELRCALFTCTACLSHRAGKEQSHSTAASCFLQSRQVGTKKLRNTKTLFSYFTPGWHPPGEEVIFHPCLFKVNVKNLGKTKNVEFYTTNMCIVPVA